MTSTVRALLAFALVSPVLVGSLLACDKADEAPTNAPEPAGTPAEPTATDASSNDTTNGEGSNEGASNAGDGAVVAEGGRLVWAKMNPEQRREHMAKVVLPGMKDKFKAHDANAFAKFGCDTCHGKNGKDVGFAMPNDLTPLDPQDPIGSGNAMDPEMTKFMAEIVVPEMAKMLDTQPYDPKTGQGFGCFDCHLQG